MVCRRKFKKLSGIDQEVSPFPPSFYLPMLLYDSLYTLYGMVCNDILSILYVLQVLIRSCASAMYAVHIYPFLIVTSKYIVLAVNMECIAADVSMLCCTVYRRLQDHFLGKQHIGYQVRGHCTVLLYTILHCYC